MRLRTDERGVTVQVGTVLLFAILIVLLSTYQATVVPQQNERVEFAHNDRVHGQLRGLRDELHRTAVTGSGGSASVDLGTQYPVRALFVNPPAPSGTLRTTAPANLTIRGANASGAVGDYWNGSAHNFSTRGIVYAPNYNVYHDAPTTVYRNGVLYNRFDDANVTLAGQRLVRGNQLTLVAVNGSLSTSSSRTATVDLRAVSAATRTVTVRNESQPIVLTVPATLPADDAVGLWRQLLAGELDETGTHPDKYVESVAGDTLDGQPVVRIALEPDATYELRLAKVGVGSDVSGVSAHYVTDVRGDDASVPENSSRRLTVEVRDRYDNPVSGATVNVTLASPGLSGDTLAAQGQTGETLTNLRTDGEGRATVTYRSPTDFDGANRRATVEVSMNETPGPNFDPESRTNLSYDLTVVNTDGSGPAGDGGRGNGSDAAYRTHWNRSRIDAATGMDCYANDTCRYDRAAGGSSATLTAGTDPTADGATVRFAVNDTDVAAFPSGKNTTNAAGRATASLNTKTTGNVTVYAASGGSGDALAIEVYDSRAGGGGGGGSLVYNNDSRAVDSPTDPGTTPSAVVFGVRNQFDQQLNITDVRVEPRTGIINRLSDPSTQEGQWRSELYVAADTHGGLTDIGGGTDLPTTIDVDADGQPGASYEPVLSGGSDATIYLYKFREQLGFRTYDVDMTGQPVTITITYRLADGTTGSTTFTVTPT